MIYGSLDSHRNRADEETLVAYEVPVSHLRLALRGSVAFVPTLTPTGKLSSWACPSLLPELTS